MGRSPCCEKVGLKKGPWTPEEDHKLLAYIQQHGHGSWRALPAKAGLQRCGKSCRLRWTNYLRTDIKRGKFSLQEEQTIIQLHALLGNRWSAIATHLPKRTDNEIKNYWNTHLKKRLAKMGIDPVTHKPENNALLSNDGQSKHAANLSHMAQWESARLEAEARLARQSSSFQNNNPFGSPEFSSLKKPIGLGQTTSRCFDILKAWDGMWARKEPAHNSTGIGESPTSSVSYSENQHSGIGGNSTTAIFEEENCNEFQEFATPIDNSSWAPEQFQPDYSDHIVPNGNFTDLLLSNPGDDQSHRSLSSEGSDKGGEYFEENKNYWNSILNVVNSSPADSPVFEWEFS